MSWLLGVCRQARARQVYVCGAERRERPGRRDCTVIRGRRGAVYTHRHRSFFLFSHHCLPYEEI